MSQLKCKNCGYPWSTYKSCPNCGSKVPYTDTKKNQPTGMGCFILFLGALVLTLGIGETISKGFIYNSGTTIIVVCVIVGLLILVQAQNKNKQNPK